ncbi:MAG: hypothetical protein L6R40_003993 [Gallowayella cf. fulva]|nr:MAG: hypothetical protein L6R40_003993 [Xanthomendoza cf. fulva]
MSRKFLVYEQLVQISTASVSQPGPTKQVHEDMSSSPTNSSTLWEQGLETPGGHAQGDSSWKAQEGPSRPSLRKRLHKLSSSLTDIVKRLGAIQRLNWPNHEEDEYREYPEDDQGYDQDEEYDNDQYNYDDGQSSWSAQGEVVVPSRFSKLATKVAKVKSKAKQRIARLRRKEEVYQDPWDSTVADWTFDLPEVAGAGSAGVSSSPPALPKFSDPLPELSQSLPHRDGVDFLAQFLSERRLVDIHPERQHQLAMFLSRVCEEASFALISSQFPASLPLLRISTPDQFELQEWIYLVGRLRFPKGVTDDGSRWPNVFEYCYETSDNVARLRQVAVHHWDYDSRLIEDVADYLSKLGDRMRLRQLGDAIEELYHFECAAALRQASSNSSSDGPMEQNLVPGHIRNFVQQASNSWSTPDEGFSQDSVTTLVGDEIHKERLPSNENTQGGNLAPSTVGSSSNANDSIPSDEAATVFPITIPCTPLIQKPSSITTNHQLLSSYQETLERILFNFSLRHMSPQDRSLAFPLELPSYETHNFIHHLSTLYSSQSQDPVWSLLRDAREIRNAAAHRHPFESGDLLQSYTSAALALAALLGDEDALRKIRLTTWVAEINFRASGLTRSEEERSLREWQDLRKAAKKWQDDLHEYGYDDFLKSWLYGRLAGSISHFREQVHEARLELCGAEVDGIIRSWEQGEMRDLLRLRDVNTPYTETLDDSAWASWSDNPGTDTDNQW